MRSKDSTAKSLSKQDVRKSRTKSKVRNGLCSIWESKLFVLSGNSTSEVTEKKICSYHSPCLTESMVVSSCTGTQRNQTLTNCVTTPCMDMKTIGIPPCTGTPGQPRIDRHVHVCLYTRVQFTFPLIFSGRGRGNTLYICDPERQNGH